MVIKWPLNYGKSTNDQNMNCRKRKKKKDPQKKKMSQTMSRKEMPQKWKC